MWSPGYIKKSKTKHSYTHVSVAVKQKTNKIKLRVTSHAIQARTTIPTPLSLLFQRALYCKYRSVLSSFSRLVLCVPYKLRKATSSQGSLVSPLVHFISFIKFSDSHSYSHIHYAFTLFLSLPWTSPTQASLPAICSAQFLYVLIFYYFSC